MARIDEIREQIGLNKFIMGLISVMIFSIVGFSVSHYENIHFSLMLILAISIVILIYLFVIVFSKTIEKIKLLKDL